MKLLEKVHSKLDRTIKYVFEVECGLIGEAAYIDKDDGKDIICVSTHTGCDFGCKFCHTTDCKGKVQARNISGHEIHEQVMFIRQDLNLRGRMLLVSYMGCGEPLNNMWGVVGSMYSIHRDCMPCRFAIATMLPQFCWSHFFDLIKEIRLYKLEVKLHLSLHFIDDEVRKEWMPMALPVQPSLSALEFYAGLGGKTEIHYALIDGVNDDPSTAHKLGRMLMGRGIPVKLLKYNVRPTIDNKPSQNVREFMEALQWSGVKVEYYEPPGIDVGASCGQFLADYYLKYNKV